MYLRIFLYFLILICWLLEVLSYQVCLGSILLSYLVTGGTYTLYLIYHSAPRDLRGAFRYLRLLIMVYFYQKQNLTVPSVFQRTANKYPNRVCLHFEDESWTFKQLDEYSNKIANFLLSAGFKHGQSISLFMENRPEYVGTWLGCSKIGVVPALINFNLRGQSLIHSILASTSVAVIFGTELAEAISEVSEDLENIRLYSSGSSSRPTTRRSFHTCSLDRELQNHSHHDVPESVKKCLSFTDKLLYIYTSGTTGLPKAAVVKNSRFYFYCGGVYYMNAMYRMNELVFYDPLPLYHSAGGVVGIGLMMCFGATVVLRQKFSVRNFWKDCIKYNCNGAQYIGEICRYLLSVPESPEERNHRVEIMFGNGLRPQIWQQFVDRFGVKYIGEFYGATEGNSNVLNIDSKPGSVGFTSVLFPSVYPVSIIRVDQEGNPVRDERGLCIRCNPGEPGEFVGKIIKGHPSRGFDGYVDKKATENKIVHSVLRHGDMYCKSGDLLYADEFGWMYFMDRMGDTYRWRGENVSTVEVESVISSVLEQTDSVVYGVDIPGVEGKAGMAAIVEDVAKFDLEKFLKRIKAELPIYAIPLFIRLVGTIDLTGTFKIRKLDLVREGYDPKIISDPLFFYNAAVGSYCKLDTCLYEDIVSKRCHL
ncbi:long-chain fatty acid transport protein 4 [Eurytemora carolleeae]|uniref:long-chain fatty acid transport protein 4 n=1 Tax=Eurytemora carolleeae TaxID=1294199 RepID=UPI000C75A259|nr:long-chain fatty acid transport protein 4 [Eurytemora carolleeae]|eukprot:XP_023324091.1 long-chain fatty acid transport protein 4-like [Eurytemora affinis]